LPGKQSRRKSNAPCVQEPKRRKEGAGDARVRRSSSFQTSRPGNRAFRCRDRYIARNIGSSARRANRASAAETIGESLGSGSTSGILFEALELLPAEKPGSHLDVLAVSKSASHPQSSQTGLSGGMVVIWGFATGIGNTKRYGVTADVSRTHTGGVRGVHGPAPPSEPKSQPLY
jgi:hypothetical protein